MKDAFLRPFQAKCRQEKCYTVTDDIAEENDDVNYFKKRTI